ncbi:MAG: PEP-CTERM sorting domain-containing protein, partial [Phycisphaerae bacterium]
FSVGSLANAGLLEFQGGTFRLTDANLAVGPGGPFGARLALREDQRIEVVHDAEVLPGGELGLQGGVLAAGRLTNHGLITGRGRIEGPLTNGAGEVEVGPGERLRVTGPAVNDGGQMTLGGGTMHFEETLTNTGGGLVMGNGLLRADGGLTNEATMAFSGVANVVGDVENTPAGLILATGVGPTTFFDDVHNDGEIRVSAGSTAVYFGAADGDGNVTGTGMNYFEGDLKPGSSAGIMSFEGNVAFGAFASLQIELADPDNSDPLAPRYDALDVVGDVDLAGTLDLSWLPVAADPNSKFGGVYSILTYGGMRTGIFDGIDCQMEAYLDTSMFDDGIEYDDANGEIKVHLYDLLVGDADLDGRVARGDFQALQDGFGSPDPDWFGGDFNFDGRVDFLDYLTWKANVGDSVPGAIPEPATVGLLALGALALVARMRRRS